MAIQNLKREINAIESKTEVLVVQMQEAYQEYLDRLGMTVQRQLIAACYYLCTQLFPNVFLKLKYGDRERLQRSLQSLAEGAKQSLTLRALGQKILEEPSSEDSNFFFDSDAEDGDEDTTEDIAEDITEETAEDGREARTDEPLAGKTSGTDHGETPSENMEQTADPSQPPSLNNPQILVDWYSEIEEAIVEVLREVSHQATHILERSEIIHNQLPEPLIEMATQSEAAENVGSEHPNILNLVVEMGKINEEGRKSSTQRIEIIAIYLRLSDLEFTDTYLVGHRNKLRSQFQQLKSLSKIYHKRSRDYAIAQAEAAWRSSWLEE